MNHADRIEPPRPSSRWSGLGAAADAQWRRAVRYVKARRAWGRAYRALSYLRSALWVVPLVSIFLVLVVSPPLRALDAWLGWRVSGLGVGGARSLFETVITLTLSFMVFTFGSLLVAIQVASGQLTPRIIATALLRDNVVRYSVGLFVFTLVFTVAALDRLGTQVPELVTLIVTILGIACMATFLFLIDYAARLLRPVSIVARIGEQGLGVVESVYPNPTEGADEASPAALRLPPVAGVVGHTGSSQIVLALDAETLVAEARRFDGVVEFVPQIGDFVAQEEPLFRLHGGAARIEARRLAAAVAFGVERTMEQDPLFAFRILVDIALKALSPAINDPTTAVLAIDQIHRLLREAGKRQLHRDEVLDQDGRVRLVHRTPDWLDFVGIACTEIRHAGAGQIQIARRMRAMLDNLLATLPSHRHAALIAERGRLDALVEQAYTLPDDLALARIPDVQGLGAPPPVKLPSRV